MAGDRVKNHAGNVGTVTSVTRATADDPKSFHITVKWDQGVIDIDYTLTEQFILISRMPTVSY